jgi:hypothetical protein
MRILQEERHGHFVGGIEHARRVAAPLHGFERQGQVAEGLQVRLLEGELGYFG